MTLPVDSADHVNPALIVAWVRLRDAWWWFGMAEAEAGADEVAANRELWTQANSEYADEHAYHAWTAEDITWGIFNVPEQQLGVLGDVRGLDVVELGCGTAYFSAWLARRGARPTD